MSSEQSAAVCAKEALERYTESWATSRSALGVKVDQAVTIGIPQLLIL